MPRAIEGCRKKPCELESFINGTNLYRTVGEPGFLSIIMMMTMMMMIIVIITIIMAMKIIAILTIITESFNRQHTWENI